MPAGVAFSCRLVVGVIAGSESQHVRGLLGDLWQHGRCIGASDLVVLVVENGPRTRARDSFAHTALAQAVHKARDSGRGADERLY